MGAHDLLTTSTPNATKDAVHNSAVRAGGRWRRAGRPERLGCGRGLGHQQRGIDGDVGATRAIDRADAPRGARRDTRKISDSGSASTSTTAVSERADAAHHEQAVPAGGRDQALPSSPASTPPKGKPAKSSPATAPAAGWNQLRGETDRTGPRCQVRAR